MPRKAQIRHDLTYFATGKPHFCLCHAGPSACKGFKLWLGSDLGSGVCGADLQNTQIQFTGETGFVYSVRSHFKPFYTFVSFLLLCVFKFVLAQA